MWFRMPKIAFLGTKILKRFSGKHALGSLHLQLVGEQKFFGFPHKSIFFPYASSPTKVVKKLILMHCYLATLINYQKTTFVITKSLNVIRERSLALYIIIVFFVCHHDCHMCAVDATNSTWKKFRSCFYFCQLCRWMAILYIDNVFW